MSKKERHVQQGWEGLNTYDHDTLIRDDQFSGCNNVQPSAMGRSWKKRPGYANVAGTAQTAANMEVAEIKDIKGTAGEGVICASNDNIYDIRSASFSSLGTAISTYKDSVIKQWNNKVFLGNGAGVIKKGDVDEQELWITDRTNRGIKRLNIGGKILESKGTFGTGDNQYSLSIWDVCVWDDFAYIVDAGNDRIVKVWKDDLSQIDTVTITLLDAITTDGNFLYITTKGSGGTHAKVHKYTMELSLVSSTDLVRISTTRTGVCTDGTNLFSIELWEPVNLVKRSLADMSVVTNQSLGNVYSSSVDIEIDGTNIVTFGNTTAGEPAFAKYAISDFSTVIAQQVITETDNESLAQRITVINSNYYITSGTHDTLQGVLKYDSNFNFIERYLLNFTSYAISANLSTNRDLSYLAFRDLASPNSPVALDTGVGGNVNATISYKTTWYNPISELETSGGLASGSIAISTNISECSLDFRNESFLSKTRAEGIGVTHHRIYRKDGTGDYRLHDTYPVWWDGSAAIDANQATLTVLDSKGMFDPGTTAPFFYVQWDDEVLKVTDIARADSLNYTTGTIATTAASNIITGAGGADFVAAGIIKDDTIVQTDTGQEFTVEAVVSTTSIRATEVAQSTDASSAYVASRWSYTTWTILRAQKGTDAADHTTTNATIYLYSIEDNTASLGAGEIPPVSNAYVPSAKCISNFQGRFLLANSPENPSRFWWSDVTDEDIIRETSFVDVAKDDGDEITGFTDFGRGIVIWKQDSIWYLSGDLSADSPNMALEQVASDKGCISAKTIKKTPYGIVFYDERGVWLMKSLTNIIEISRNIKDHIDSDLNHKYTKYAVAEYYSPTKEYLLSVPNGSSQTTNNQMLVMNMQISDYGKTDKNDNYTYVSWYLYDVVAASMAVVEDSNGDDKLYIGNYDGYIFEMYKADTWTDDDGAGNLSAITAYFETKNYNFGFEAHKKFKEIIPTYEETGIAGSIMTLSYKADNGTYKTYPIPISGTSGERNYSTISPQHLGGERLKIKFNNDTAAQWFKVFSLDLPFTMHKVRER